MVRRFFCEPVKANLVLCGRSYAHVRFGPEAGYHERPVQTRPNGPNGLRIYAASRAIVASRPRASKGYFQHQLGSRGAQRLALQQNKIDELKATKAELHEKFVTGNSTNTNMV